MQLPKTRKTIGLALLAALTLFIGCKVVLISGPVVVSIGDTVAYVLEVRSNFSTRTPFYLLAEVPAGWQLESSTFVGTVGGTPIAGDGLVVQETVCEDKLGDLRPGYRRWSIVSPDLPEGLSDSDVGELTLEFLVVSQPSDEIKLFFVFGSTGDCSRPEVLVVNRQGVPRLQAVQALFDDTDGVDGLDGLHQIALSPDDQHLYLTSLIDRSITGFTRDGGSGQLTFLEADTDAFSGEDALGPPFSVAISPDGLFLYVTSVNVGDGDSGTAIYSRDPVTGKVTLVERVPSFSDVITISPAGHHLYESGGLSGNDLAVYSRDEASGGLTLVETYGFCCHVTFSPDGRHLYAAGFGLDTLSRDEINGELTFLGKVDDVGLGRLTVSPDGRHLYAISGPTKSLRVYARDAVTGLLTPVEILTDLTGESLDVEPVSVAVSPDGAHVFVGVQSAIVMYARDPSTGRLTVLERHFTGNLPIDSVDSPLGLVPSADGRHLYVGNSADDALAVFETSVLFQDGFEGGSTSAWSLTVD